MLNAKVIIFKEMNVSFIDHFCFHKYNFCLSNVWHTHLICVSIY